jgi:hypothetical protein
MEDACSLYAKMVRGGLSKGVADEAIDDKMAAST